MKSLSHPLSTSLPFVPSPQFPGISTGNTLPFSGPVKGKAKGNNRGDVKMKRMRKCIELDLNFKFSSSGAFELDSPLSFSLFAFHRPFAFSTLQNAATILVGIS